MNKRNKPKVAIIIDKEGWALDNIAQQIKKNLNNFYEIDIIPSDIFEDNVVRLFLLSDYYDLMFFMWRGIISWLYSEYSKEYISNLGFQYDEFISRYLKGKNIVTAVYDHLFLETERERTDFILNNVKSYVVSSKKLKHIYDRYPNKNKPVMVISDGVDLDLFRMYNPDKYVKSDNNTLIIGWTGNSKFMDNIDDDLKGVNKVLLPAIEELKQEGYNITLNIADRNIKMIPHEKMPDYYNEIDIYVCASRTEGTPNPILEAMACGVPIISTDVGIVSEVLGEKQKKFIIERTKDDLKSKLLKILKHKEVLKQLSDENLKQIQGWSWNSKSKMFKKFFEENL